ncbi:MAG: hypothetical protein L0271_18990 [Gemmatimonadetes bacterium]|nr:hypothetical protein [Gemmatimonadota bacterium]
MSRRGAAASCERAVSDDHRQVECMQVAYTVRTLEVAQLPFHAAFECTKHVDDDPDERDSTPQLTQPKGDGELEQIAGRASPAAPPAFCVVNVRLDDALFAQVDEAMQRLVEEPAPRVSKGWVAS